MTQETHRILYHITSNTWITLCIFFLKHGGEPHIFILRRLEKGEGGKEPPRKKTRPIQKKTKKHYNRLTHSQNSAKVPSMTDFLIEIKDKSTWDTVMKLWCIVVCGWCLFPCVEGWVCSINCKALALCSKKKRQVQMETKERQLWLDRTMPGLFGCASRQSCLARQQPRPSILSTWRLGSLPRRHPACQVAIQTALLSPFITLGYLISIQTNQILGNWSCSAVST